jgi:hypothetical protein
MRPHAIRILSVLSFAATIVVAFLALSSVGSAVGNPSYRLVTLFLILILSSNILAQLARAYTEARTI